ncbi:alginate O-acetyltransferase complex protein AlgJ [Desulforhopalus singaporensis]|uniref:Alginate O-acetyltransferase complex protein AlgJ n=2 Tax=Desulforhopalus singaporensis TaxID=91360 RepID=A0A1H0SZL9_9BACT|nr:alginate O-acetyltransferase complex protein AlgJ [Desulforhopalus singaporensis]
MKLFKILCTVFLLLTAVTVYASPGFREVCGQLAATDDGTSVVAGEEGWLFLKEELQHIGAGPFWGENAPAATRTRKKEYADPVPAIVAYNKLLAKQGIKLYLMPVPPKALIYSDKVSASVDPASVEQDLAVYKEFYRLLEKEGVSVIDLIPLLRADDPDKEKLYCRTDTHFSVTGLSYFAKEAAQKIKESDWYDDYPKTSYRVSSQSAVIQGDLQQMSGGQGQGEEIDLAVVTQEKTGKGIESDPASPVILLGDSHTLVFSAGGDLHAKGSGLFDHLSKELGFAVDLLGVRGSGVTPARIKFYQRSKKQGDYLKGKKVMIWCFAARDFTGSGGWREIPVAP